jgi:hypothetical protein
MVSLKSDTQRRLLFVLHRGLVEARQLSLARRTDQLFDLADALEPIPGCLTEDTCARLEDIRCNLSAYEERYRGSCFEYTPFLLDWPAPERF